MQKKRLGCLSPLGLLTAFLTLLAILATGIASGGAMFNPGPLNAQAGAQPVGGVTSHAATGGRCSACHPSPWETQTMSDRCLACHTELITNPQDFHNVMLAQSRSTACYECHTDHHGESAALTTLDLQNFPHLSLGFSLQAHRRKSDGQAFICSDCHTVDLAHFDPQVCTDCHAQIDAVYMQAHMAWFGKDCLACHDGVDRYGEAFDHNRLNFPLTGRHAGLPCGDCHSGAQVAADFQSATGDCAACHAKDDAHQGRFGTDCGSCHTAEDWQKATFDHSKSAFPLTGAHQQAACEDCHANNIFKGTPQACVGCHVEPAVHAGLFGDDCAACHTTAAWSPARYGRPHTFPIDHGESGASTCQTCHPQGLQTYTCYGCHEHTPSETASKHQEEDIGDFADCMRCHPTGHEDGGGEHN